MFKRILNVVILISSLTAADLVWAGPLSQKDTDSNSFLGFIRQLCKPWEAMVTPQRSPEAEQERNLYAHYMMGVIYENQLDYQKATEEFVKAQAHTPNKEPISLKCAAVYIKLKQYDNAKALLDEALNINPKSLRARFLLALLYIDKKEFKEAAVQYEKIIEENPQNILALSTLADIYVAEEKLKDAVDIYTRLIKHHKFIPQLYFNLGLLHLKLNQQSQARINFKHALRLKPGYLEPLVALSVLAELRKDYAQALYYYNKVIAVSGEYSMAIHLKLGRLYAQLKNIERSQKEYQWVLERDPHETRAYQGLAELYIANDKKDEAVKALNRSLIYDDKDPYTFLLLGIAYLDEKEYNKAIDYFKKASQADAEYEPAYFYLGSSYERIGKHQEAKNYLKKAIELNPKDADALNYLGYMYAEDNEQLDEAERLIKRALALEPKNGAFIDSLGWVYYKKGDLIRAKILIETALKLIGDDEVIYEHLGDVYDKLGEGLKAKKAWRKSLELKK